MNDFSKLPEIQKQINELYSFYIQQLGGWEKSQVQPIVAVVDEEIVHQVVSKMTGVKIEKMKQQEANRLIMMEDTLSKVIIGQDEAIKVVSRAIKRGRLGIKKAKKPIGSFIFLGPTGVGKTEVARRLAEFLFGSKESLIRIDMSDFMERHTISRLVGAPPGYVGYEEGGILTEMIRRKPYSIILFDEIEKAHIDFFNMLLQILEEGELVDNFGNKVDFKNTVIIMTSNIGSDHIIKMGELGFETSNGVLSERESLEKKVMSSLRENFRPEFLNRIDEIIIFNHLGKKEIKSIVDIEIAKVADLLLKNNGIKIQLSTSAKDYLAEKGYDPTMGARPLRRVIQKDVLDPLALKIISGEIKFGERVVIDSDKNGIVFKGHKVLSK